MRPRFLALLAFASISTLSSAQLTPRFLYNGVGRSVPVTVSPARDGEVALFVAGGSSPVAVAPAMGGVLDLSKAFPDLWVAKRKQVLYLQYRRGGTPTGAPLVLQPMTNPSVATLDANGRDPKFSPDEDQEFAGYRIWVDQEIVFETSLGNLRFRTRPDCAPNTTFNVLGFVQGGLYRDTIFHRVVPLSRGFPFVIQGGDPAGTGSGGPGWAYPLEKSRLPHDFGVISIARSTDPNTNGCQIFVCLSREGTARLDGRYAAFGQLLEGAEVVKKIAAVPTGAQDRPKDPPVIRRARLVPAAPYPRG